MWVQNGGLIDFSRKEPKWTSLGFHLLDWNVSVKVFQGEPPRLQSAKGLGCPNQQSVDLPICAAQCLQMS